MILTQQTLLDEDSLKDAIRRFSRYQKTDEDTGQLPPAAYDALILAGNPSFVLTVAPLLSYYDMDPNRVIFLGTDLWARSELLSEPSMQGALVTQATKPNNIAFEKRYQSLFDRPTNDRVRLGFDAFALIAVARRGLLENSDQPRNTPIDWRANLIRKEGFEGLSGRFNLLPDGLNQRFYNIYRIEDNQLVSFSSP